MPWREFLSRAQVEFYQSQGNLAKMAKDKEKLFKGSDDKAITFQRAVFIVCNLKKLIKRPAKEHKSQTFGSYLEARKRSDGNDCDIGSHSASGLGSNSKDSDNGRPSRGKFKNPVRRAFTLPTMLCNSIIIPTAQSNSQAEEESFCAAGNGETNQTRRLQAGNSASYTSTNGATNLDPKQRVAASTISCLLGGPPAPQPDPVSAAGDICRAGHQSTLAGNVNSPPIASTIGTRFGRNNRLALNDTSGGDAQHWLGQQQQQEAPGQLGEPSWARANKKLAAQVQEQRQPDQGRSQEAATGKRAGNKHSLRGQPEVCCPIWALAMEQLDARQRRFWRFPSAAQIGLAPTSKNFLINHQQHPPGPGVHSGGITDDCQGPRVFVSTNNEPNLEESASGEEEEEDQDDYEGQARENLAPYFGAALNDEREEAARHFRRSSEEFPAEYKRLGGGPGEKRYSNNRLAHSDNSCYNSNLDNTLGSNSASKSSSKSSIISADLSRKYLFSATAHRKNMGPARENQQQPRDKERRKHKSRHQQQQISAQRDSTKLESSSYNNSSNCGESLAAGNRLKSISRQQLGVGLKQVRQQEHQLEQEQQQQQIQQMKRFSSAQCLADKQQKSRGLLSKKELAKRQQKTKRKTGPDQAGQKQRSKAEQTQPAAGPFLLPDEPMALARQRRPSLCNQASVNVDQQAFFSAVECNQIERARSILKEGKVNVNSLNGDKLTCLDIAVLMQNVEMVNLLQQFGAKESSACLTYEGRANQLHALYLEARRLVEDLSRSISAISGSTRPGELEFVGPAACSNSNSNSNSSSSCALNQLSGCEQSGDQPQAAPGPTVGSQLMLATGSLLSNALFEEKQRQLQYWRRRLDLFMHMRYEFEKLEIPSPPELIVLQVVGESALAVRIVHSLRSNSVTSSVQTQPGRLELANSKPEEELDGLHLINFERFEQESLPRCAKGSRCSHWQLLSENGFNLSNLLDENLLSTKRDDSNAIINDDNNNLQVANLNCPEVAGRTQSVGADLVKQQKLVAFNHLLEEQLNLLRIQHKLAQQELSSGCLQNQAKLAGTRSFAERVARSGRLPVDMRRPNFLLLTQNNSTDSACDFRNKCDNSFSELSLIEQSGLNQNQSAIKLLSSETYKLMTNASHLQTRVKQTRHLMQGTGKGNLRDAGRALDEPHSGSSESPNPNGARGEADQSQQRSQNPKEQNQQQQRLKQKRPGANQQKVIVTKYRIEWSLCESMENAQSIIFYNNNQYPLECRIDNLINGQLYYVRVSSGNHKGFSDSRSSQPACLSPSSWRQLDSNKRRKFDEEVYRKFTKLILLNKHILDDTQTCSNNLNLLNLAASSGNQPTSLGAASACGAGSGNKSSLINMLLLDATTMQQQQQPSGGEHLIGSANNSSDNNNNQQEQQQATTSMRKNLKNFFQSNSCKFHKLNNQNKRGLYLATIIYYKSTTTTDNNDDSNPQAATGSGESAANLFGLNMETNGSSKIVVTNDDRIPVIEILNDLISMGALMSDFYWLLKINGTQWIDIKRLRQQLQKSHSSSTLHLRIKLLHAIEQMQLALNMEDLGKLYYKPIQAHDGSIIIVTCKQVLNLKQISNLSIKWTQYHKIIPRHLRKISDSITNNLKIKNNTSNAKYSSNSSTSATAAGNRFASGSAEQTNSSSSCRESLVSGSTGSCQAPTIEICANSAISRETSGGSSSNGAPSYFNSTLGEFANFKGNSGKPAGELKVCEHCQCSLVQRRSTMATGGTWTVGPGSGSNQKSSQWSLGLATSGGASAAGRQAQCNCRSAAGGTSSAAPSGSPANPAPSFLSSLVIGNQPAQPQQPVAHQRGSASAAAAPLASSSGSLRSSSMTTTPIHHHSSQSSTSTRMSSNQTQFLSAAQKSSNYLMLASLSLYDLLLFSLNEIIYFDKVSCQPLSKGLYLGFVQLQTTVESMRLLVPRSRPNMVPCARIRDNPHVSREEWQLLKRFASTSGSNRATSSSGAGNAATNTSRAAGREPQASSERRRDSECINTSGSSSQQSVLVSGGRGEAARAKRVSDSSTWSFEQSIKREAPADEGGGNDLHHTELGLLQSRPPGFGRMRAKSESPGLAQQEGGAPRAGANQLSFSASQIIASQRELSIKSVQSTYDEGTTNARLCDRGVNKQSTQSDGNLQQFEPPKSLATAAAKHKGYHSRDEDAISRAGTGNEPTSGEEEDNDSCEGYEEEGFTNGGSRGGQFGATENRLDKPSRGSCIRSPTTCSRLTVNSMTSLIQSPEETFVRLIGSAAKRLLVELKSKLPKYYANELDLSQQMSDCEKYFLEPEGQQFRASQATTGKNSISCLQQSEQLQQSTRNYLAEDETLGALSILQSLNDDENNRIYHMELIELGSQVTFILLIPSSENVCPVTSAERANILDDNVDYMLLPLQIFETIHIGTYEPDLFGKYSRLSTILETDLVVAQHDHRQAFSSNELKSTKSRLSQLQDMVLVADEFWRQLRWIVDVVSYARDKSNNFGSTGSVRLETIWRYFELSPSVSSVGHSSDNLTAAAQQGARLQQQPHQEPQSQAGCELGEKLHSHVKGTISARARDEQSAPESMLADQRSTCLQVMDSVPEIHLTKYSSSDLAETGARQVMSCKGAQVIAATSAPSKKKNQQSQFRRHSGDQDKERSAQNSTQTSEGSKAEWEAGGPEEGPFNLLPGEQFGDLPNSRLEGGDLVESEDEDDNAIYAYHISLKDATSKFGQSCSSQRRKSSQSIRVTLLDNDVHKDFCEHDENGEMISILSPTILYQQQQPDTVKPFDHFRDPPDRSDVVCCREGEPEVGQEEEEIGEGRSGDAIVTGESQESNRKLDEESSNSIVYIPREWSDSMTASKSKIEPGDMVAPDLGEGDTDKGFVRIIRHQRSGRQRRSAGSKLNQLGKTTNPFLNDSLDFDH